MAWDFFKEKNGAPSLEAMESRIRKYRRSSDPRERDFQIGCIQLSSPFFFSEPDWIPVPADWSPNIVQGKGYNLRHGLGAELWAEVGLRLRGFELAEPLAEGGPGDVYGQPMLVRPRLGQGIFRSLVTDTYERRCAVTAEKALPVLDAAHIRPVAEGGRHLLENGLLLRSDLHRLYDAGYVTVTPDYRVRVSRRLKTEFDNGEPYFPLDRRKIWLPVDPREQPRREFLEWHSDVVFRG